MPFLLSVWLSRCQALTSMMAEVSGKMIKKTAGALSRAKIASGGGPTARMKTATAALLGSDPASGCKTLASPAFAKSAHLAALGHKELAASWFRLI